MENLEGVRVIDAIPDPNSDLMVTLLHDVLQDVLRALPFSFSTGDLMGALMYLVIEIGLEPAPSPDVLRRDIVAAVDRIIDQMHAAKQKKN